MVIGGTAEPEAPLVLPIKVSVKQVAIGIVPTGCDIINDQSIDF